MDFDLQALIGICWAVFFLGWFIWGITSKQTKRRQTRASRLTQVSVLTVGIWASFIPPNVGPLRERIIPPSVATEGAAIVLTAAGFGLAVWARLHLGGNWSGTVTVKEGHQLTQTGPYVAVRHPIYTGFSLSALGLTIMNGNVRSFAALALVVLGFRMKIQLEEQFMTEEFGDAYLIYKRNVKALIPFVW
jgi:protein-S-isoprenylcysteine O-methyltransferase Ste14